MPAPPKCWGEFLVLPENWSAARAARGLAKALLAGKRPPVPQLALHGAPGTGKTHLAATLLRALAAGPAVVTARNVAVGDLARIAVDAETPGFNDPDLLACDLLVLEDVQLLPTRATDPVCDLLDRRASRRKATVVTANAGPAALGHLSRRLTSRLSSGLVVQLESLSPPSRRSLLEAAAIARKVRLTDDALDFIVARAAGGGARALLGLLGTVAPLARGLDPLTRTAVENILAGSGQPTSNGPDVSGIVKRVADAFGVTEKEIHGSSRLRRVLVPRQVAMYLAREVGRLSLPRIGAAFGGRDHTTVLHACRKVEADIEADAGLAGRVRQLRSELG